MLIKLICRRKSYFTFFASFNSNRSNCSNTIINNLICSIIECFIAKCNKSHFNYPLILLYRLCIIIFPTLRTKKMKLKISANIIIYLTQEMARISPTSPCIYTCYYLHKDFFTQQGRVGQRDKNIFLILFSGDFPVRPGSETLTNGVYTVF